MSIFFASTMSSLIAIPGESCPNCHGLFSTCACNLYGALYLRFFFFCQWVWKFYTYFALEPKKTRPMRGPSQLERQKSCNLGGKANFPSASILKNLCLSSALSQAYIFIQKEYRGMRNNAHPSRTAASRITILSLAQTSIFEVRTQKASLSLKMLIPLVI